RSISFPAINMPAHKISADSARRPNLGRVCPECYLELTLVRGMFKRLGPHIGIEPCSNEVNHWAVTNSLRFSRHLRTATLLQSGRVLIAGGGGAGTTVVKRAELGGFQP